MSAEKTENEMDIWGHITELRKRLLWAMGSLVLTTVLSVTLLARPIIDILSKPAGGQTFIAIEPTEAIGVYMRVSLLAAFIIALPFILYQVIAFIVPGLYPNERRALFLAIPVATLLFIAGVAFSYFIMLPAAILFLYNFLEEEVQAMWRLANYINFITNLMFWIGLSFETPLLVYMLARFGLVSAGMLLKQWRYAIVIIAIVAAFITPTPDPVNMGLVMAPLFVIYLLSALFASAARPREKKPAA